MLSMICSMICLDVKPSISFSGEITILCFSAGMATYFISSGMMKSLPLIAAKALAEFKMKVMHEVKHLRTKKDCFLWHEQLLLCIQIILVLR